METTFFIKYGNRNMIKGILTLRRVFTIQIKKFSKVIQPEGHRNIKKILCRNKKKRRKNGIKRVA